MNITLPVRPLGSSGIEITKVGLGAWAMGGGGWAYGWGAQDDEASLSAMRRALDFGINWIDTAAVYGLGHSEALVGRFLKGLNALDRPLVFTKCGLVWDDDRRLADPRRDLTPDSIRAGCEASLRRLGIERIDLFQFHWPDTESGTPIEDSWGAMAQLADEGKVHLIGVSNFDAALLDRCEPIRHVDSLQPPFSLIRRAAAEHLIPWCAGHGTGVICYSPMQAGLLTGTFSEARMQGLAADDWRRRSAEFRRPALAMNLELRDRLRPVAERHETSVSAVAVAWTLAWPGVTGAIVGARSAEQVEGWVEAATLELTPADLDEIAVAVAESVAGSGPSRPKPRFEVLHRRPYPDVPAASLPSVRRLATEARRALVHLHKSLLLWERAHYEQEHGRVSSADLLQLILTDQYFAWLRPVSAVIVRLDEALESLPPVTAPQLVALLGEVRGLLKPEAAGSLFGRRYAQALQQEPELLLAHGELSRILHASLPAADAADPISPA